MLLNCGVGEDSWESLGLQGDPPTPSWRTLVLNIHWKDWCWNWSSNTLATWFEELTHLKRPWCWEKLKVGGEGDDRGWDGWMASLTQWTWVWANSRWQWRTGKPDVLQSMGSQGWRWLNYWMTTIEWLKVKGGISRKRGSHESSQICKSFFKSLANCENRARLQGIPGESMSNLPSQVL